MAELQNAPFRRRGSLEPEPPIAEAPRPSRFTVPAGAAGPLLDLLCDRFPAVGRGTWAERLAGGRVRDGRDRPLAADSPCRPGMEVRYFREVPPEPPPARAERILHRDAHLLVVEKPAFMPVSPTGPWLERSLLRRLQAATGLPDLSPAHRLDQETAGLMLFAADAGARAACAGLFQDRRVRKTYRAVGRLLGDPSPGAWAVEDRLEPGEPFFRMRRGEGEPNARSAVRLLGTGGGLGAFEVAPETGRKHQVRLHLAGLGFPILHDRLYPDCLPPRPEGDGAEGEGPPLQLLAWGLDFVHPFTGEALGFRSGQVLEAWATAGGPA